MHRPYVQIRAMRQECEQAYGTYGCWCFSARHQLPLTHPIRLRSVMTRCRSDVLGRYWFSSGRSVPPQKAGPCCGYASTIVTRVSAPTDAFHSTLEGNVHHCGHFFQWIRKETACVNGDAKVKRTKCGNPDAQHHDNTLYFLSNAAKQEDHNRVRGRDRLSVQ